MAEHYYIDAYNVIHKSSLLSSVVRIDLERARNQLIDKVVCFCMTGNKQVTIVFDGRQQKQTQVSARDTGHVTGMRIIYSPHHTSADTVIERLIYLEPKRMDCIVVTNDGGLRSLCRGMGALTMEADSFLASVRQFQQGTQEALKKRQKAPASLLEDRLNATSMNAVETVRNLIRTPPPSTDARTKNSKS